MESILIPAVRSRSRQTMLPLLVALFLISYVLLTTLVVLQNRTIDAQRGLIHLLFKDNLHLSATKVGLRGSQMAASNQTTASAASPSHKSSTQTPTTQAQPKQTPSNQVSATQTPSVQVPVIQATPTPQANAKSGRSSRKAQKAIPAFPPAEVTDPSDMRRVSISI